MSVKNEVIAMIQRMPDDVTHEEILYAVYVRRNVDEGLRQLNNGEGIPHDEVVRRLRKWSK